MRPDGNNHFPENHLTKISAV